MKIRKLGAIDIGSNGVRLLINTVYEKDNQVTFNKTSLTRLPIRLGQDVFINNKISDENIQRILKGMQAFKNLMEVYGVEGYLAYATSAMRNATNGEALQRAIQDKCEINLEIIDGNKEAQIIFKTELKDFVNDKKNYLFIDVGGGSTELTILKKDKIAESKSFKVGTVRLLNGTVKEDVFPDNMKRWIKKHCKGLKLEMIGSGGNINYIFKHSGCPVGESLDSKYLFNQYKVLKKTTYEERLHEYNMKTDRADVILPALEIFTKIAKWSDSKCIHVPKIGLADGMIQYLYMDKYGAYTK